VALSTCRGLRGVIFDGENLHHIHPEDASLDSTHYLYKQGDLIASSKTCGKHVFLSRVVTRNVKEKKEIVDCYPKNDPASNRHEDRSEFGESIWPFVHSFIVQATRDAFILRPRREKIGKAPLS